VTFTNKFKEKKNKKGGQYKRGPMCNVRPAVTIKGGGGLMSTGFTGYSQWPRESVQRCLKRGEAPQVGDVARKRARELPHKKKVE